MPREVTKVRISRDERDPLVDAALRDQRISQSSPQPPVEEGRSRRRRSFPEARFDLEKRQIEEKAPDSLAQVWKTQDFGQDDGRENDLLEF